MTYRPVSSVPARGPDVEPVSPAARTGDLAALRAGAVGQLRDAQERLERLAGTLGTLSEKTPQAAAQAALRACAVRVQNLSYDLQRVGPATGLSAAEPVEELEGA